MVSYFDTVMSLTAAILDEHRADHRIHADGLNVSGPLGRSPTRIGDLSGIVADFGMLKTRPDLVAHALAALALNGCGIKHTIPATGLTISIGTPKSTIPVRSGGYRMNMLRCRS